MTEFDGSCAQHIFAKSTIGLQNRMEECARSGKFQMPTPVGSDVVIRKMGLKGIHVENGILSWDHSTSNDPADTYGVHLFEMAHTAFKSGLWCKMEAAAEAGIYHVDLEVPTKVVSDHVLESSLTTHVQGQGGSPAMLSDGRFWICSINGKTRLSWGGHADLLSQVVPTFKGVRHNIDGYLAGRIKPHEDEQHGKCVKISGISDEWIITHIDGCTATPEQVSRMTWPGRHTTTLIVDNPLTEIVTKNTLLHNNPPTYRPKQVLTRTTQIVRRRYEPIGMAIQTDAGILGVLVKGVDHRGLADMSGLRPGDIIVFVNGQSTFEMSHDAVLSTFQTHRCLDIVYRTLLTEESPKTIIGVVPKKRHIRVTVEGGLKRCTFEPHTNGLCLLLSDACTKLVPGDVIVSFDGVKASKDTIDVLKKRVNPIIDVDLSLSNRDVLMNEVTIVRTIADGYGMVVVMDSDIANCVVACNVIHQGPAYNAGIRTGDIIKAVDRVSLDGKSHDEIVMMMTKGNTCRLTVLMIDF